MVEMRYLADLAEVADAIIAAGFAFERDALPNYMRGFCSFPHIHPCSRVMAGREQKRGLRPQNTKRACVVSMTGLSLA